MKPGRELDIKIAELMGWTNITMKKQVHIMALSVEGVAPGTPPSPYTGYKPKYPIASYSTDIAAAWLVLEKFKTESFKIEYDQNYGADKRSGWSVTIGGTVLCQFAETSPHAICLAALQAFKNST